jgi:L-cysteine/cystine lyase
VVAPVPPDAERLAAVRGALPALSAGIYLNTGSVGPLPAETAAAMAEVADRELQAGRAHPADFADLLQRMEEARASVAAVLTADTDDIALTHSATDGMNIAIHGLDWRAGDKAVTTRLEHPGAVGALLVLRERVGIDIDLVALDPGSDADAIVDAFDRAIDTRTRAVVVSHVQFATGTRLPIERIAPVAHDRGALLLVDGAQAAGAIPVDLATCGADAYAVAAQKWLLGPAGMGALAIGSDARDRLRPIFAGGFTFERFVPPDDLAIWPNARRFEASGWHPPSVVGMARSIGWLSMFIGLDWIHGRGAAMAAWAADRLAAIPGVELLTPRGRMAGLVTFRIAGWSAEAALDELGARVFAIARTIPFLDAVRISVGFYSSQDELERFASAVELLAANTPATLPPRRALSLLADP